MGQRKAGSLPCRVNVNDATVVSSRPMMCLQGDCSQGRLLIHWWWYILLVQMWCQREDTYRERLVLLKLGFMSPLSVRLRGRAGIKHQGMFSISGCVLKAIWCAWMQSCGLSEGVRIRRNMVLGCPSVLGCSRIVLKVLGNISCGLRVF